MIPDIREVIKHYPEFDGIHPACEAVPMIDEQGFADLVADIKANGLLNPLIRMEGRLLLDGRTRLLACYQAQQEIRVKDESGIKEPFKYVYSQNCSRRDLTVGQKAAFVEAWRDHEEREAKRRMQLSEGRGKKGPETLPDLKGDVRDKLGDRVGISGKSVDKFHKIKETAPEIAEQVKAGTLSLEQGYKDANKKKKELESQPVEQPQAKPTEEKATVITAKGVKSEVALPKKVVFNKTNDSVDWARWTWNPVTGCEHGCKFCYAREIAHMQRMEAYYPNKFEPTFHEYRLGAPKNTSRPESDDARDGRVFVCSMADLFGKWVPEEWIRKVFDACLGSPEWEYLFLTKYPARYSQMPLIDRAWYGASVIQQSDVSRTETQMSKFDGKNVTRWISLEPMLEPIRFTNLSWCNLVVIGSQTSTNQPDGPVGEFAPEFDWIVDVVNQCREFGVPYYLKANLGMERPGMVLPKGEPSR